MEDVDIQEFVQEARKPKNTGGVPWEKWSEVFLKIMETKVAEWWTAHKSEYIVTPTPSPAPATGPTPPPPGGAGTGAPPAKPKVPREPRPPKAPPTFDTRPYAAILPEFEPEVRRHAEGYIAIGGYDDYLKKSDAASIKMVVEGEPGVLPSLLSRAKRGLVGRSDLTPERQTEFALRLLKRILLERFLKLKLDSAKEGLVATAIHNYFVARSPQLIEDAKTLGYLPK